MISTPSGPAIDVCLSYSENELLFSGRLVGSADTGQSDPARQPACCSSPFGRNILSKPRDPFPAAPGRSRSGPPHLALAALPAAPASRRFPARIPLIPALPPP